MRPGLGGVSLRERPTIKDVIKAQRVIKQYLSKTPLHSYPALNQIVGTKVWVKHENHQPVGAFKIRGGINLIANLSEEERERGVISASTGNHGQSVSYAANLFGMEATIGMPEDANPGKVDAIRSLGAEVLFHGKDFDEVREYVEKLAKQKGQRYIHSGNEPFLIAGVGTYTLEILCERPEIEIIIVPVGGGSGASGACIVAKSIDPSIQVIGVQSELAPSAYLSWKSQKLINANMGTAIEGLATRTPFRLPQSILWDLLDDFVLVSDEDIFHAISLMIEKTHNLPEGAGAAPLAAALKMKTRLSQKNVALVLSGGNLSKKKLRRAMQD